MSSQARVSSQSRQKQLIAKKAAQLFAKRGYDATGVAELGDAVGLGRGALYHHIGSKETLLYEICIAHVVDMVEYGEALLEESGPADEKLRKLARRLTQTIAENLPELTVFFADFRSLAGKHRDDVSAMRQRFERTWEQLLERGVEEGTFRTVDPIIVKGVLGMFNYSYLWLRPRGGKPPEEIADTFSDVLLRGLSA